MSNLKVRLRTLRPWIQLLEQVMNRNRLKWLGYICPLNNFLVVPYSPRQAGNGWMMVRGWPVVRMGKSVGTLTNGVARVCVVRLSGLGSRNSLKRWL